ncbi:MAG: hypothetical protein DMG03_06620 [Acidobacteria bacterium]|nr:MAG: hypothetical protein DMG03_06620 [Acidobacteriota bacterium]
MYLSTSAEGPMPRQMKTAERAETAPDTHNAAGSDTASAGFRRNTYNVATTSASPSTIRAASTKPTRSMNT